MRIPLKRYFGILIVPAATFITPHRQVRVFSANFAGTWMRCMHQKTLSGLRPIQVWVFFSDFCWYLDEVYASEGAQWPAANPGMGIFDQFCWYLAVEGESYAVVELVETIEDDKTY